MSIPSVSVVGFRQASGTRTFESALELLERRVLMSASGITSTSASADAPAISAQLNIRLFDRTQRQWVNVTGTNDITIPESEVIDVQAETFSSGGRHFHGRLSATRDGTDICPPTEVDAAVAHDVSAGLYGNFADNGDYQLQYEVTTDDGQSSIATFTVHVTNEAPTATIDGPSSSDVGKTETYMLGPTRDADGLMNFDSYADQMVGIKYSIDWNGDGQVDEVVQQPGNDAQPFACIPISHTFTSAGLYDVSVSAEDKDGAHSEVFHFSVTVSGEDDAQAAAAESDASAAPHQTYSVVSISEPTTPSVSTISGSDVTATSLLDDLLVG